MAHDANILERIVAHKRRQLETAQEQAPMSTLERSLSALDSPRDFALALRSPGVSLIAEIKRASPSRGLLRPQLDASALAQAYQPHASAVSVLTEERFFLGSSADLSDARGSVTLPVLRKDFLFTTYQIVESRAWGADAVLLIAAILEPRLLRELRRTAEQLGMSALVEVHDEAELERALDSGANLIGINNRDLRSFRVDLDTTRRLRELVPPSCTVVSESGIHGRTDVERLSSWRVDAMLVGEALVQAEDLSAKLKELTLCPLSRSE